jgi:hypothetical protein
MEEETWGGGEMTTFVAATGAVLLLSQGTPIPVPLPAEPPIGGPIWTIVIPAVLFLGSLLGTYLLYQKFSKEETE